jgi:FKBP-type peptidyl-prolyl cis-trans isomerase FkpA
MSNPNTMIKNLSLFVLIVIVCFACSKEKETPNGMKFKVHDGGDGTLPKKNQIIIFNYLLKDSKDSVWANTFEDKIPAAAMIADSSNLANEDGMSQMFRMLSVGDSVSTSMSVGNFFKNIVRAPIPPTVDSTRTLTYTIAVTDVVDTPDEYYKMRAVPVASRDAKSIGKYLADNQLTAKSDTSGLQFIIHNQAGGQKPTVDDCVEVKYVGKFLRNGQIFDASERVAFPLRGVITGWQLGIPMLGKGDSATFFIPSALAYGPRGFSGAIPPDAVLIFDVTLLDVKKEFDQATRSCK